MVVMRGQKRKVCHGAIYDHYGVYVSSHQPFHQHTILLNVKY